MQTKTIYFVEWTEDVLKMLTIQSLDVYPVMGKCDFKWYTDILEIQWNPKLYP